LSIDLSEECIKVGINSIKQADGRPLTNLRDLKGARINIYKYPEGDEYYLEDTSEQTHRQKFEEKLGVIENYQHPKFDVLYWEHDVRDKMHFRVLKLDAEHSEVSRESFINSVVRVRFVVGSDCPVAAVLMQYRPADTWPKNERLNLQSARSLADISSCNPPSFHIVPPKLPSTLKTPPDKNLQPPQSGKALSVISEVGLGPSKPRQEAGGVTDLPSFLKSVDSIVDYCIRLTQTNPASGDLEFLNNVSRQLEASSRDLPFAKKFKNCAQLVHSWNLCYGQFDAETRQLRLPEALSTTSKVTSAKVPLPRQVPITSASPKTVHPGALPSAKAITKLQWSDRSRAKPQTMSAPFKAPDSQPRVAHEDSSKLTLILEQPLVVNSETRKLSRWINENATRSSAFVIPSISMNVLEKVLEFFELHIKISKEHEHSSVRTARIENVILGPADYRFIDQFSGLSLRELAKAAFLLLVPSLLELCFEKVRRTLRFTQPAQIAGHLELPVDDPFVSEVMSSLK
jgi:hypothetical protein